MTTFKLNVPITTHQGEVDTLTFKEPTARLYMHSEMPYTIVERIDTEGRAESYEMKWNPPRMFKIISELTGHDTIILGDVHASDVIPLFQFVRGLLGSPPTGRASVS